MDKLAFTHVEFNYMENLAKTFIFSGIQIQFIQENIFSNVPVRRSDQRKQTLHSLDLTPKLNFGMKNLTSDNFEDS